MAFAAPPGPHAARTARAGRRRNVGRGQRALSGLRGTRRADRGVDAEHARLGQPRDRREAADRAEDQLLQSAQPPRELPRDRAAARTAHRRRERLLRPRARAARQCAGRGAVAARCSRESPARPRAYGGMNAPAPPRRVRSASTQLLSTMPVAGSASRLVNVEPSGPAMFGSLAPSRRFGPTIGCSIGWLLELLLAPVESTTRSRS